MKRTKRMKGMSKFVAVFMIAILTAGMLGGCSRGGDAGNVSIDVGTSQLYSEEDVNDAMNAAIRQFRKGFEACTMTRIWYDEEKTRKAAEEWAADNDADEGIVLYSDFEVDESGRNPSLNPGQTYTRWQWVLVRDKGEKWRLVTWGYG